MLTRPDRLGLGIQCPTKGYRPLLRGTAVVSHFPALAQTAKRVDCGRRELGPVTPVMKVLSIALTNLAEQLVNRSWPITASQTIGFCAALTILRLKG